MSWQRKPLPRSERGQATIAQQVRVLSAQEIEALELTPPVRREPIVRPFSWLPPCRVRRASPTRDDLR